MAEVLLFHHARAATADSSLPSYDADAAALLTRRMLDFLRSR
jgi:hypothetical protein